MVGVGASGQVDRASNVAADATSQILVAERQIMPAQISQPLIVDYKKGLTFLSCISATSTDSLSRK